MTEKTIYLERPGTLRNFLPQKEIADIQRINISGKINAKDMEVLYSLVAENSLQSIDLGKATSEKILLLPFKGLTQLRSIVLPANCTEINANAFSDCTNLSYVYIPDSVNIIGAEAFKNTALTSVYIPCLVKTTKKDAFANTPLQNVTFADVSDIGSRAFSGCSSLREIRCNRQQPPTIAPDAFMDVNKDCLLIIPSNSKDLYRNTAGWNLFSNNMVEEKPFNEVASFTDKAPRKRFTNTGCMFGVIAAVVFLIAAILLLGYFFTE